MNDVLTLEHLAIAPDGPALSLSIGSGTMVALTGPAGSGKRTLLRVLAGAEKPAQGRLSFHGNTIAVADAEFSRRAKVQALARNGAGPDAATEALMATRLWDVRHLAVGELPANQAIAAELLQPLSVDADLVLIDGQLDRLDPWALPDVLALMQSRRSTTFIVSTHRPDIVEAMDSLIVLMNRRVRFAGTVEELIRTAPAHHMTVATDRPEAALALVQPLSVRVEPSPDGLVLTTAQGQETAARLLTHGYGVAQFVVDRAPTVAEALRAL